MLKINKSQVKLVAKQLISRTIAITSCIAEIFTDKRAPTIGACYSIIDFGPRFWLRPKPEDVYDARGIPVYTKDSYTIDPTKSQGSFIVLKMHGVDKPVWDQWVNVMFTNSDSDIMKGWLPRWEFVQLVNPK